MKKSTGGMKIAQLIRRVLVRVREDNILGRAAQLSYYFLLALFPLLLFLTTLLGFFARAGSELRKTLLEYLGAVMPASASQLIYGTVDEITRSAGGGKLSIGLIATLWAASSGMLAICEALNFAYKVKESRSWWKARLVALALTIILAILIISALILILLGGTIAERVANHFGFGDTFTLVWAILQWPIAVVFILLAFSLIYHFGPNLPYRRWRIVTPGSLVGVVLWLLASYGFRAYLNFFNSYSATYGSLGAVIVLMLWFYFTGAAILIGGELNSELEKTQ